MISLILATFSQLLLPVLVFFSLHLMLRGHNAPGGGFIAGLMTAAALALQYIAFGSAYVRAKIWLNYRALLATGLALAGGTGIAALFYGRAFLEHRMFHGHVPLLGAIELGTPLLFDLGVYCVVVGVTLMIISTLGEERQRGEDS